MLVPIDAGPDAASACTARDRVARTLTAVSDVLGGVHSPADLRGLSREELTLLAAEIRDLLVQTVVAHRRPPRPEPRRRRTHHRAAPRSSTRRPSRSCSTSATRPTSTRSSPAAPTGCRRLRQTGGLSGYPSRAESRARLDRELARLDRAVLRRRAGQGLRRPRRAPPGRGRRRRRRAHRRHVLGGAEQHRRRATVRWSSSSTTTDAPTRRPSAGSPTTWPGCGCARATSGCSASVKRRARTHAGASARRSTTRCTA